MGFDGSDLKYKKMKHPPFFKKGSFAKYRKTKETVQVIGVHYDDDPSNPYYTIRMPDGQDRGTVVKNLYMNCIENIPVVLREKNPKDLGSYFTVPVLRAYMKSHGIYNRLFHKEAMVRLIQTHFRENEEEDQTRKNTNEDKTNI